MHPKTLRTLLAALFAVTAVACTSSSPTTDEGTDMDPLTQLQGLPSSEDAVTTYTAVETQIRDAITKASPNTIWEPRREQRESGCRDPFDNLGGRTVILASYGAPTPIPDDAWPAALAAAETIARSNGFDDTQVTIDRPGDHQVRFTNNSDGAYIDVGTGKNALVTTNTGCHLPAVGDTAG